MSLLILLAGIALIGLVALDMIATTLALSSGGGPLTGRVSDWLWKLALTWHSRAPSHRLFSRVVWVMLLLIIALWALLLLIGWSLVFTAYGSVVVNSNTGEAAGFWSRVYFAGFSLITLGVGDYRPQGPVWQLATVMAAVNGFSAVTLTLAYLIPVVSAGVEKRQLAASISGLGDSPQALLLRAWNGADFSLLTPHLVSLASNVNLHAQRHLAYPVLHYFHSEQASMEDAVTLARLDEALTVLACAVREEHGLDPVTYRSLRQAVTGFLDNLHTSYIEPADEVPPLPSLEPLRARGVPMVGDEAYRQAAEALAARRALLLALVQHTGWPWEAVAGQPLQGR